MSSLVMLSQTTNRSTFAILEEPTTWFKFVGVDWNSNDELLDRLATKLTLTPLSSV
jgi:hypothetical protein